MRLRAVLGLLLLVWPLTAHAEWREASSAHFVVYADDTARDIQRFSEKLERYHAALALVTGTQPDPPSPSNRVTVYVVRDEREVRRLAGGDSKFLGGFYIPRAGGSLAIVPEVQGGNGAVGQSMLILLHEYAHHFMISGSAFAMPRWMSEGGAEFFASAKFDADGSVGLGLPAMHRAAELFLPQYAPDVAAADLIDPTAYDKRKGKGYDAFYGKSWLLYHYLTFDEARAGQLQRYIALMAKGKSSREAGLEVFGDFGVLEKDLDRYLKSRKMFSLKLRPDMVKPGPVSVRLLAPGEAAMMPVQIRSRRGVNDEQAKALLADARAVAARYPADPAVLSALAEAEHDAGNDAQAVAAADAALARDPALVNAYVQKGLSLMRLAEGVPQAEQDAAYRKALAPFLALNSRENDHPLPLIYNYTIMIERGKQPTETALRGLARASSIAPFDLGLRMNLAMQLLRFGRNEDARVVLAPVAFNPHGGGLAEYARKVIARSESDPKWDGSGMTAPGEED